MGHDKFVAFSIIPEMNSIRTVKLVKLFGFYFFGSNRMG
jgi:hypothetical protein